jgi:GT2 family glycosyltransferase
MEMLDRIVGVVVLYNCKIEDSETVLSLAKSLEDISDSMDLVVYDNSLVAAFESGSVFKYRAFIVHYFHDATNPGVSKAYNFAAQYALHLKKQWLLLLDQDTTFSIDAISNYVVVLKNYPQIKLFAPVLKLADNRIISPSRYCFKRGFALKEIAPGIHRLKKISPLNSGMLINLEAFRSVGGYNEKVKLDFSDFQFIERFKRRFDQFCVINVIAKHSFSDIEINTSKLNERFMMYCYGAKNCDRNSFIDRVIYFMVVFFRATNLVYRTKNIVFYKTFIQSYLR